MFRKTLAIVALTAAVAAASAGRVLTINLPARR